MNRNLGRVAIMAFLTGSLLIIAGCTKRVDVTSVSLSESAGTMRVGDTFSLAAIVNPAEADYDGVTWTSGDPFVASLKCEVTVYDVSRSSKGITNRKK